MRRWSWDPESIIEITLTPTEFENEFIVRFGSDILGDVQSYEGSLDRVQNRIRWPGKRRKLWSACILGGRREHAFVSRAEAIRWLLGSRS